MKSKNKKICLIASSGGHLEELKQLKKIINKYNTYFVVAKTKSVDGNKEFKYKVCDFCRKNKILYVLTFIITFFQQLYIFIKERPDVVITTGPGMVVPTCLIAKLFKKKLIFIESFARMTSPSKTGEKLYRYADLFFIQNEYLKKFYPNSIYKGALF